MSFIACNSGLQTLNIFGALVTKLEFSRNPCKVKGYFFIWGVRIKDKVHPCTGSEALYKSYGP